MHISFDVLTDVPGFLGASLADSETGMVIAKTDGGPVDMEIAAAANTEVVRAKRRALEMLGFRDTIEDLMISLETQYHLLRIAPNHPTIYLYVALDREKSNLALARMAMKRMITELEQQI